MKKEKLDQIKIDLETDSKLSVQKNLEEDVQKLNAESNVKASKKTKKQKEPQTISIEESYYIDEDGDKIAPPNREIFKKITGFAYSEQINDGKNKDSDVNNSHAEKNKSNNASAGENSSRHQKKKEIVIDNSVDLPSSEIETRQGDIYSDYYEYTSRKQRKDVIGMYKYAKRNIRTKIVLVSILTILLFLIENINLFIVTPIKFLSNPYILTSCNIFVFLLCAALSYEQLYHGMKSISSKEYIPESVAVVATVCAMAHSVLMLLFISFENEAKLYNFPVAIVLICVLLYSYLNVSREKYGFGVVSSKDVKYYLEKATKGDDDSETETFSSSVDEFEGEIARIKKTVFISDYFANTNTPPKLRSYLSIYLTCSLLIPAILAIVSLFIESDFFFKAVSLWYVGVLLMMPVGVLFSYSVPFLKGNKYLYDDETAIIGENAINEFASTDVASVNDTTAFPPYNVKLTEFQTFANIKTEKILFYATQGFMVVGGPLADVFGSATKDAYNDAAEVKFSCAGKNYFCVKIDGDTVIFADRDGIISCGIDAGNMEENEAESSVLYMACNSTLCAKFFLTYRFDSDFLEIVSNLNKNKVSVGIRTFDPNINQELIKKLTQGAKVDLRVIRLVYEDSISSVSQKSEGKIVSRSHSKYLLKAIPVCKKISKIRKVTKVLKILASITGATLVGLSLFGMFSMINSIFITCYHLAVMFLMWLITIIVMPSLK